MGPITRELFLHDREFDVEHPQLNEQQTRKFWSYLTLEERESLFAEYHHRQQMDDDIKRALFQLAVGGIWSEPTGGVDEHGEPISVKKYSPPNLDAILLHLSMSDAACTRFPFIRRQAAAIMKGLLK